jgi:high affinity sulfate transporter 1
MSWTEWAPGVAQFRGYKRAWLRGDLLAGLTVAAYLIPQVMAYATLAGLSPIAGLWAALAPLLIYALLGSSRHMSVGPESTTALMVVAVLAPFAAGDASRYAALAAVLGVLVGAICFLAGIARLGFLANLLSRPVLVGYMAGVAFVMMASQLGKLTGASVVGDEFVDQMRSFARGVGELHWPTMLLAGAVLALLLALDRWAPRVPGPLIAVLAAAAAVAALSLKSKGIVVVGSVPSGLPRPAVPFVSPNELATLVIPAAGIAIVAFSDNILTARIFATRHGYEIDANAELRAIGVCNIAAGLTRGFPVSSSGSRSAIGDAVGSRTQVYSLVALAMVLVVMLFASDLLAQFPSAALGALVVYAALRLIDIAEFRRLARFRRSELVIALVTTAAVLGIGVLYGVLAAVALSVLDLLRRVARGHDSVLGFVPGVAGMHDIDDYPQAELVPGLVVYRYDAPLCFANAEDFRTRALRAVDQYPQPVEWFVLNAEANVEIDMTALDALDRLRADLAGRGILFAMARVKQDLRDALKAGGLLTKIGDERIFMTLPTAVEAFRRR